LAIDPGFDGGGDEDEGGALEEDEGASGASSASCEDDDGDEDELDSEGVFEGCSVLSISLPLSSPVLSLFAGSSPSSFCFVGRFSGEDLGFTHRGDFNEEAFLT